MLEAGSLGRARRLGFDYGNGEVPRVAQKVVRPFLLSTDRFAADYLDSAVREGLLLRKRVRKLLPLCVPEPWRHVDPASVRFI